MSLHLYQDEAEQEEVPSEKDEQLRESDTGHNPPQPIEKSEVEKLSEFKAKFMRGLMLIKFGRNSIAKRRVFVLNIETRTFTWKVPTEAPKRSRFVNRGVVECSSTQLQSFNAGTR